MIMRLELDRRPLPPPQYGNHMRTLLPSRQTHRTPLSFKIARR